MEKNELAKIVIDLYESEKLTSDEINMLKRHFEKDEVNIAIACITNKKETLEKLITEGKDISICNGKILRFCVMEGYVDLSMILLKNKIEP